MGGIAVMPARGNNAYRAGTLIWGLVLSFLFVNPGVGEEDDARLNRQRQAFLAAEQALAAGHQQEYQRLKASLRDYPLYPYLQYAGLARNLDQAKPAEISAFLATYADTPLAPRLQRDWLRRLAERQRWALFVEHFGEQRDANLRCHYATALLHQGRQDEAYALIEELWQVGRSQPPSCDRPFTTWRAAGQLTDALVWERIRLAMQANNLQLARYLARYLDTPEQHWVELWQRVRRSPALVLREASLQRPQHPAARWILADGVQRLARAEPGGAAALWNTVSAADFDAAERQAVEGSIATALIRRGEPEAHAWVARLDDPATVQRLAETRFLAALRTGDWPGALQAMEQFDAKEAGSTRAQYWRARALEQLERYEEATDLYRAAADSRSYYGFLAAERVEAPYSFGSRPVSYPAELRAELLERASVRRARELFVLGRQVEARREWHQSLRSMDEQRLQAAAHLAHEWGWHDRVIVTLAQAEAFDDLELRFPLAYRQVVMSHADRQQINPAWAYAVIRQESAFAPDARSHAGAMGLMQLMPNTARQVAKSLQLPLKALSDLFDADTNIRLGVSYLQDMKQRFDGNPVLATAAYNAGHFRVERWLPQDQPMAADVWVENVPFAETRDYLKRVLSYTVIYEQRLERKPTPLRDQMPPIPARLTRLTDQGRSDEGA